MRMFSSTTSLGQRWKMFLPGAASAQCDALSVSTAAALVRSQWQSDGAVVCRCGQALAFGDLKGNDPIGNLASAHPTIRHRHLSSPGRNAGTAALIHIGPRAFRV